MSDEEQGKFRERRESAQGGIVREEQRRRSRETGLDTIQQRPEELKNTEGLVFVAMVDQLMPAGTLDADVDQTDFGIASLLAAHKSERVSTLLERARNLTANGQWRPALAVLQEARTTDPQSATALVMQVQCLLQLDHHEAALRVVSYAREQVTDTEARALLLRCEAACVRAITKALEGQIVKLLNRGKIEDAFKLTEDGLSRQPSNLVLLYHLAKIHCLRSELDAARRTIEEARRHMGPGSLELFAELERSIDTGLRAP